MISKLIYTLFVEISFEALYSINNSKKVTVWTVFKYLFFTFSTCTIKQCNHKSNTIALIELLDLRRIQNNECHDLHPKPKLMQKNEFIVEKFPLLMSKFKLL